MCCFLEIIILCKGTPEKDLLAFVSLAAETSPRSWTPEYTREERRVDAWEKGVVCRQNGGDAVT